MITIEALKEQLENWVRQAESNAEEAIQEYENQSGCDEYLSKAAAFQQVLDFIESSEIKKSQFKTGVTFDINFHADALARFGGPVKSNLYRVTNDGREFISPMDVSFMENEKSKAIIKPSALAPGTYYIELLDHNNVVLSCWQHVIEGE